MTQQQPKFSVVLIAKNELQTLPRLLNSLQEFRNRGGEIVLVDTGSTDGTPQLARDFGCKVEEAGDRFVITIPESLANTINEKFVVEDEEKIAKAGDRIFDFSAARNYAASLASNDMIAMPDCDEEYTAFDIDKINSKIDAGIEQLEYNFVFAHDGEGKEVVKFLHSKFYNRQSLKWVNVVHEVLQAKNKEIKRAFFEEDVVKLEHWQNQGTNRSQYLTGLAYDFLINPTNDRNAHYFGRELVYTGRFKSALLVFHKHIAMGNAWLPEKSQSLVYMGDCMKHLKKPLEAGAFYLMAFDIHGNRREPLMRIAEMYYEGKHPLQTMAFAAAATQIQGDNYFANFQPYYEHIPHEMLYWAYWQIGDKTASQRHFNLAQNYQPFNPKYLHDMRFYYDLPTVTFVIPTMKRPEGLKRCVDSIAKLNYPAEKVDIVIMHDNEPVNTDLLAMKNVQSFSLLPDERQGVPKNFKEGVARAMGDWVVYASNDTEFTPESLIIALKTAQDNAKQFMAFNSQGENGVLADEGNICEHFMIHRELINKLKGEIFDTEFYHVGVDNLLWARMKKWGQAMWCKRAVVNHFHFSQTQQPQDEVAKLAWKEEAVKHDRELLVKKLAALAEEPIIITQK